MEKYLYQFCQKLFHFLDSENHCTENEKLQMYYAIQILLYNISVAILILVAASIIGSFMETLLLFCVFGTLRVIAGGFHFNNILLCVTTTSMLIVMFNICGILSSTDSYTSVVWHADGSTFFIA